MAKDIKYVPSGGLVLSEEKDMKKLSKLAKEGWILESFEKLSYKLRRGKPEDVIYCVDYNEDKEEIDSYLELFESSQWKHVCSFEAYHFFKASSGTQPIYTDKDSLSLKYEKLYNSTKKSIVFILVLAVLSIAGAHFMEKLTYNSGILETLKLILYMVAGGGIGITIPLLICAVKAYKNIAK